MAYSYKGSISFGLVYIPITLHNTIKDNSIGFNMIDKKTMSRVKYKKTCSACDGREVKQEDIVKGYEYEEGKYVINITIYTREVSFRSCEGVRPMIFLKIRSK